MRVVRLVSVDSNNYPRTSERTPMLIVPRVSHPRWRRREAVGRVARQASARY